MRRPALAHECILNNPCNLMHTTQSAIDTPAHAHAVAFGLGRCRACSPGPRTGATTQRCKASAIPRNMHATATTTQGSNRHKQAATAATRPAANSTCTCKRACAICAYALTVQSPTYIFNGCLLRLLHGQCLRHSLGMPVPASNAWRLDASQLRLAPLATAPPQFVF